MYQTAATDARQAKHFFETGPHGSTFPILGRDRRVSGYEKWEHTGRRLLKKEKGAAHQTAAAIQ